LTCLAHDKGASENRLDARLWPPNNVQEVEDTRIEVMVQL